MTFSHETYLIVDCGNQETSPQINDVATSISFVNNNDCEIKSLCLSSDERNYTDTHWEDDDNIEPNELQNNKINELVLPEFIDLSSAMCSKSSFKTFKNAQSDGIENHNSIGYVKCCEK